MRVDVAGVEGNRHTLVDASGELLTLASSSDRIKDKSHIVLENNRTIGRVDVEDAVGAGQGSVDLDMVGQTAEPTCSEAIDFVENAGVNTGKACGVGADYMLDNVKVGRPHNGVTVARIECNEADGGFDLQFCLGGWTLGSMM